MRHSSTPARTSDRGVVRLALLASAAMLLWMARPLLLGEVPLTGDLLHFHYPLRDFYARALSAGQRFDWMPSLAGGFDVVGEGQLGGYHPLHWLWYRLLPLDSAFMVEILAAYPFVFAGTWLFIRRWCDAGAAAVGAMLFTFSGFNLSHGVHPNMVSVIAHLPWLLWCIHGMFAARTWHTRLGWSAAIGALTGSQLLLGHPQAVWLSGLVELAYLVFLAWTTPSRNRARAFVAIVSGKSLGLAIGAIQVAATAGAILGSTRAGFGADFPFTFAMPASHLLELVNPYMFWGRVLRWTEAPGAGDEFGVYGGAVTLVLVVWWMARLPWRRIRELSPVDRFALAALVFAGLGLCLALGRDGKIYYLQTFLPVVGMFRVPLRFVVFTHLALACVAAVAVAQLSAVKRDDGAATSAARATWILVPVSIVLTLAAPGLVALPPRDTWLPLVVTPAVIAVASLLLTLAARGARAALPLLVLVAAADLGLYGIGGVVAWHDFAPRAEVLALLGPPASLPPTGQGRIGCCPYPNLYVLAGYKTIDGYLGLVPARRLNYRTQPALRLAQVGYAHRTAVERWNVPVVRRVSSDWYRLAEPLGRARLVTGTRVTRNLLADLAALDVERTALVTHDLGLDPGDPGTAAVTRDEPGLIEVRTHTGGRQLLVVSEMFQEGWTAVIDGTPAAMERVNGDFAGCVVPSGEHAVRLAFRPRYRSVGGLFGLAGAGCCLALAAISWFCHRSTRPGAI